MKTKDKSNLERFNEFQTKENTPGKKIVRCSDCIEKDFLIEAQSKHIDSLHNIIDSLYKQLGYPKIEKNITHLKIVR
ncbi:MAG: hypothetical protein WCP85_03365 [Mariniphaga sp.]